MGHRNPDRVPVAYRRRKCESVADMAQQGWDVLSTCRACGLVTPVNLRHVAKISGPSFSLWNLHPRYKRVGCVGFVDFLGKAPGMTHHEVLEAPWPDGKASSEAEPYKPLGSPEMP